MDELIPWTFSLRRFSSFPFRWNLPILRPQRPFQRLVPIAFKKGKICLRNLTLSLTVVATATYWVDYRCGRINHKKKKEQNCHCAGCGSAVLLYQLIEKKRTNPILKKNQSQLPKENQIRYPMMSVFNFCTWKLFQFLWKPQASNPNENQLIPTKSAWMNYPPFLTGDFILKTL